jgi:hypothetical protein
MSILAQGWLSMYPLVVNLCITQEEREPVTGSTFLDGCRRSRKGVDFSSEQAIAAVRQRLPHKAYCVVEDWTIFRAELSAEELTKVRGASHLPLFAFAHKVVGGSMGRFQSGDWARSSMCMSEEVNGFFQTKNTIYVLVGVRHQQSASLKTTFSFFQ